MTEFTKEELFEIISLLQSQVIDLRWRMNAVCNFLSNEFPAQINGSYIGSIMLGGNDE
jgi:hypothetical protein